MFDLEINLEGVTKYYEPTVYLDNEDIEAGIMGQGVSFILKKLNIRIVGGPDLRHEFETLLEDRSSALDRTLRLASNIVADKIKANPLDLLQLIAKARERAFRLGVIAARKKMREALGIGETSGEILVARFQSEEISNDLG